MSTRIKWYPVRYGNGYRFVDGWVTFADGEESRISIEARRGYNWAVMTSPTFAIEEALDRGTRSLAQAKRWIERAARGPS